MSEKAKWAEQFKNNHECTSCPFVKNDADVGVGIVYDCDHVCLMPVNKIQEYMQEGGGQGD